MPYQKSWPNCTAVWKRHFLEEICSRLKISGELNEVTVQDIRALRSHGIDLKDIEKAIQRTANISQRGLKKLLDDVVERNQQYYRDVMGPCRCDGHGDAGEH